MDFPDGPVVKTSSFNARIAGLVGELKIPYALRLNIYIYIYQKQHCNKSSKDFRNIPSQNNL